MITKKFFFSLLWLTLLPLALMAQGQKVTLKLQKASLAAAFRQVEQQSGYYKINYR